MVAGSISMQEMAVFASYFGANQHIGGKTGKECGFSGQCAGFGEDSRGARDAKWAQQLFNGGGCDGKGPLFVLYPDRIFLPLVSSNYNQAFRNL